MQRKFRIGFIDCVLEPDKPGYSGLSDISWDMAKSFAHLGHEVHVIGSYTTDNFPTDQVVVHNLPTPPMGYRNILGQIWIMKRAAGLINKLSLDILHAPDYLSTACLALLNLKIPLVLTVPGNIYERIQHGNPFDRLTTQILKAAARISAIRCSRVIVTSNQMWKWWFNTGVPTSRMVLIPYGVDTDLFKPVPSTTNRLPINPDGRPLLFVGRLSPEKGLEYLFNAMEFLCRGEDRIELHIIGFGNQENFFRGLVSQIGIDGRVFFHGQIQKNKLPNYYSAADLTILPSLSEGLPRTMLESLACASPFLGTKITGIVDHIQDRHNGYLVEPGSTQALVNKIGSILEDPLHAARVGRNGAEYVHTNLTWLKIAQRIQDEVYSNLDN